MKPTIAIVGASPNRSKFGNKAVRAYLQQGWDVYPVHPRAATIEGQRAYRSILDIPLPAVDRVSVYLPPSLGLAVIDEIARKGAGEVWLNPGASSDELVRHARTLGLRVVLGCSIVAIGVNPHELDG